MLRLVPNLALRRPLFTGGPEFVGVLVCNLPTGSEFCCNHVADHNIDCGPVYLFKAIAGVITKCNIIRYNASVTSNMQVATGHDRTVIFAEFETITSFSLAECAPLVAIRCPRVFWNLLEHPRLSAGLDFPILTFSTFSGLGSAAQCPIYRGSQILQPNIWSGLRNFRAWPVGKEGRTCVWEDL